MRFDGKPGKWWWTPGVYDYRYEFHRAHFDAYLQALDRQLTAAREGRLSPTWRDAATVRTAMLRAGCTRNPLLRLQASYIFEKPPTPKPAPPGPLTVQAEALLEPITHGCLMELPADVLSAQVDAGRAAGVDLWAVCAQLDVAAIPPADWEPYATDGDWNAALRAWYRAAGDVLTYRRQRIRPMVAAADHQIDVDLLEVSYRAGVVAGTGHPDESWKGWLAEHTYTWLDQSAAAKYRLALLDFGSPTWAPPPPAFDDPYHGAFWRPTDSRPSAHPLPLIPAHPIPDYWRITATSKTTPG